MGAVGAWRRCSYEPVNFGGCLPAAAVVAEHIVSYVPGYLDLNYVNDWKVNGQSRACCLTAKNCMPRNDGEGWKAWWR
jgi:hypothetical protein